MSLISKSSNFRTRSMTANGIYQSKLVSLIQVWGGTQDYIIRALQVSQNRAARVMVGASWYTPSRTLLRKCGWLSVRQLIAYHTVLTMHRTVVNEKPVYIHDKLTSTSAHNTRHQAKFSNKFKGRSEKTRQSFCYRGTVLYNMNWSAQPAFQLSNLDLRSGSR